MGNIIQPRRGGFIMLGGSATNIAASATTLMGLGILNASAGNVAGIYMPFPGVFTSLWLRTGAGGAIGSTGAHTWDCTLLLDGSTTALNFQMVGAVGSGSVEGIRVPFTKGQWVLGQVVSSAGTTGRPAVMVAGIE